MAKKRKSVINPSLGNAISEMLGAEKDTFQEDPRVEKIGAYNPNPQQAQKDAISAKLGGGVPLTQNILAKNNELMKSHLATVQQGHEVKAQQSGMEGLLDKLGESDPNKLLTEEGATAIRQYFPDLTNENLTQKFIPYLYKRQSVIQQLKSVPMGTKFSDEQVRQFGELGISNPGKYMSLFGSVVGTVADSLGAAIKGQAQTSSAASNPLSPLKAMYDQQDKSQSQAEAIDLFARKDAVTTQNNINEGLAKIEAQGDVKADLMGKKAVIDSARDMIKATAAAKKFQLGLAAKVAKAAQSGNVQAQRLRQELTKDKSVMVASSITNTYAQLDSILEKYNDDVKNGRPTDRNFVHQAVITKYNKMLDESSTVREAEYDRTPENQAIASKVPGYLEKLKSGGTGLTDEELAGVVRVSRTLAEASQVIANRKKEFYAREAEISGITDTSRVTGSVDFTSLGATQSAPAAQKGKKIGKFTVLSVSGAGK